MANDLYEFDMNLKKKGSPTLINKSSIRKAESIG